MTAWMATGRTVSFGSGAKASFHFAICAFIVTGHTHYPGVWRRPSGLVVVNTGSFCLPLGACCVDLTPSALTVRRIVRRGAAYHPGRTVAAFPLAPSADFGTTAP